MATPAAQAAVRKCLRPDEIDFEVPPSKAELMDGAAIQGDNCECQPIKTCTLHG